MVPNTQSRAGLGELFDVGLYDIYVREFGAPGMPRFEAARRNFIVSEAGYAIACYLLQSKVRLPQLCGPRVHWSCTIAWYATMLVCALLVCTLTSNDAS